MLVYDASHLFASRRPTLRDQSRQSPGSVSGPTSSGSFALTLIRGSLQRAILGPVQLARRPASHPPDQRQRSAVTYVALCVVSAIAIKKRFFNYRATLRVVCSSGRSASSLWRFASHNGFAMSVIFVYGSSHLFASRRPTLRDQSRQSPRSVSGPTSSGSFALSLIRGSLQRAILGPVQLARRPASHPPDQRQSSAVTYVALCVVSAIAIKKRFFNYRATLRVACSSGRSASSLWRFASHSGSAMSVMFVYGSSLLFAPRRPTLRDQSRQSPRSVSGPTSSGSFALSLIRGSLQRAILGPVQLARRPAEHPPDQRQGSAVTYVAL